VIESALSILGACVPVKVREAAWRAAIDATGARCLRRRSTSARPAMPSCWARGGPRWATVRGRGRPAALAPRPRPLCQRARGARHGPAPPLRERSCARRTSSWCASSRAASTSASRAGSRRRRLQHLAPDRTRSAASPMSPSSGPTAAQPRDVRGPRRTCSRPRACGGGGDEVAPSIRAWSWSTATWTRPASSCSRLRGGSTWWSRRTCSATS